MKELSLPTARRLAVSKQQLAHPQQTSDSAGILDVFRQLAYIQLDPIRRVERSPLLVLWSRLGSYDPEQLDVLLWQDKELFEYWAHAASIVLTDNYAIHQGQMRRFARGESNWAKRVRQWMKANQAFQKYVLDTVTHNAPLLQTNMEDRAIQPWQSGGWTAGRHVERMVSFLWEQGDLVVAKREGLKRYWALSKQHLPAIVEQPPLSDHDITRQALIISLQALGVATSQQIKTHFLKGHYHHFNDVFKELVKTKEVIPIQVTGQKGKWYIHQDDLPLLNQIEAGDWQPRTTLLSPFDNLIIDRKRTEQLWDFYYRMEIYVPEPKRQYGYYVLPILHGEDLIGRLDPKMDRKTKTLHIYKVFAEPNAPDNAGKSIAHSVMDLANFLGAKDIEVGVVPPQWQQAFSTL